MNLAELKSVQPNTSSGKGLSLEQLSSIVSVRKPEELSARNGTVFGTSGVVPTILNALTSNTQRLATTVSDVIFANSKTADEMTKSQQGLSDLQFRVLKEINRKKQAGEDTTYLESQLTKSKVDSPTIESIAPSVNKTNLQVAGEILGTALEASMGGTLSGVKGIGLAPKIAQTAEQARAALTAYKALTFGQKAKSIGLTALKQIGVATPFGYGYDVSQNLQEGKTGGEALEPGWGTLFSTTIPIAIGGVRLAKAGVQAVTPGVVSNISGKPLGAYEQLKTGNVQPQIGNVTPQSVLTDARKSASLYNDSIQNAFGGSKQTIIDKYTGSRIGLSETNAKTLSKVADRFGFSERLPQNLQNMSAKESMDLLAEINSINPISTLDDPLVKNYKFALKELKDVLKTKAIATFGGSGGEFDTAYQAYTKGKKVLSDLSSVIGKVENGKVLNPTQLQTATNRLMSIFNSDKQAYMNAIRSLESVTGERILDKVAAAHFSDWLPKTLQGGSSNVFGIASDLFALSTIPLSSPRMGAKIVSFVSGYNEPIVQRLLNSSPSVRQGIYNAVVKENKSIDEAITGAIEKYKSIPNKQGGFARLPFGEAPKGVTPAKVAKLVDSNDVNVIKKYLAKDTVDSYIAVSPILENAKITNLSDVNQKKFLQEVIGLADNQMPSTRINQSLNVAKKNVPQANTIMANKAKPINETIVKNNPTITPSMVPQSAKKSTIPVDKLMSEAKKYKTTVNIQDKADLEYLGRILSENNIVDIKSGKMVNFRGTPYSDLAKVNIVSETPKTIQQKLLGKIEVITPSQTTFYHGTNSINADSIMKTGFKSGSSLPENTFRGGGYGQLQNSISLTETPKDASRFSSLSKDGKIIEAKLKDGAKVVKIKGIEDAVDLNDYVSYLRQQNIDAVYIGGGEKELVVINPKAISPVKSQLTDIWNKANKTSLPQVTKPISVPLTQIKLSQFYPSQNKSLPLSLDEFATISKENPKLVEMVRNGTAPAIPVREVSKGVFEPMGDGATRLIISKALKLKNVPIIKM
jgi:hypothetical protein